MVDIIALSQLVTAFLAPALPYLLRGAETAGTEAMKEFGKDGWGKAKQLWDWLRHKVVEAPAAHTAAQELANQPLDKDNQTVFEIQLRKILAKDEKLAELLVGAMGDQVIQRVLAERGGKVRNIEQIAGGGGTEQTVRASDTGSEVEGIKQRRL